jgi:hypothetical protein
MGKILNFHSYLALNEQEAFWKEIPKLSKTPAELKTKVLAQLKASNMTIEDFKKGLDELYKGTIKLSKEGVKVLQMILGVDVDGGYGTKTKEALKTFQANSLGFSEANPDKMKRTDGIWGPNTAKAAFGDEKSPRTLWPLLTLAAVKGVDSKLYLAAKDLLLALMGKTENESEVYRVIKDHVKTASDFAQLESLWSEMLIDKTILTLPPFIYSKLTFEQIKQKNKLKGVKTPMSLREVIKDYFDFQEKNKLNQLLPAGVEKF